MWSLIGCVLGVDKYFTASEMWDLNVMRWYFTTPLALWFWAENTSPFYSSCSCWLSLEGGLLYAFVGPAAVIVLVSPVQHSLLKVPLPHRSHCIILQILRHVSLWAKGFKAAALWGFPSSFHSLHALMSIHTRGCPRQNDETSALILESKMSAQKKKKKENSDIFQQARANKCLDWILALQPKISLLCLLSQYESLNYALFFFFPFQI